MIFVCVPLEIGGVGCLSMRSGVDFAAWACFLESTGAFGLPEYFESSGVELAARTCTVDLGWFREEFPWRE